MMENSTEYKLNFRYINIYTFFFHYIHNIVYHQSTSEILDKD